MAKKSNKTEQVLKLLTKEEDMPEGVEEGDLVQDQEESSEELQVSEVEVSIKDKEPQELTYEAKLKIEIDPEVAIKEEKEAIQVPAVEISAPAMVEAVQAAPASTVEATPAATTEKVESQLFRQANHLVNLAEIFVTEKLDMVMERLNVCTCPTCSNDVMAMALNSLPTQYVTTDTGKQYLQLETYKKQYETDVIAALTKACVRVKAAPRHGE